MRTYNCNCGNSFEVEDGELAKCKECGFNEMQVMILAGGTGTRIRGFDTVADSVPPDECIHEKFYILKVRCEQCGTIIDKPFDTTYTLKKEERVGIKPKVENTLNNV